MSKQRRSCNVQKAAQTADEAWQQTISGLQGQVVINPTIASLKHPSSASQEEDSDDMDFSAPRKSLVCAAAPSAAFHDSVIGLVSGACWTLLSKGDWQQVTRVEDLCHAQVSHKWRYHLDACAGSVLRPHHCIAQSAEKTRRQNLGWRWPMPMLRSLRGPTAGTRRNLHRCRSYVGALRVRSRCGLRHETGRPWHYHGTQGAHSSAMQAG